MERLPAGWRSIDEHPDTDGSTDEPDDDVLPAGARVATDTGARRAGAEATRGRTLLGLAGLVALAVAATLAVLGSSAPQPVVLIGDQPAGRLLDVGGSPEATPSGRHPSAPAEAADLVVDVAGSVARPGVYRLEPGSRVADAVREAGGFSGAVDVLAVERTLNLAAVVGDGEKVRVPALGEASAAPPASTDAPNAPSGGSNGLLDLNRASADELDALPGIGPVTAAKIIAARDERPFATIDELDERGVVGTATLAKFRALVTVSR
jgi:competence protein ComEA